MWHRPEPLPCAAPRQPQAPPPTTHTPHLSPYPTQYPAHTWLTASGMPLSASTRCVSRSCASVGSQEAGWRGYKGFKQAAGPGRPQALAQGAAQHAPHAPLPRSPSQSAPL